MFTDAEILELKTYNQEITYRPRRLENQESIREDGYVFCDDWEIIEILKCLFGGEDTYRADPLPNRLKKNPLFKGKEDIIKKTREYSPFKAEDIIHTFRHRREQK